MLHDIHDVGLLTLVLILDAGEAALPGGTL